MQTNLKVIVLSVFVSTFTVGICMKYLPAERADMTAESLQKNPEQSELAANSEVGLKASSTDGREKIVQIEKKQALIERRIEDLYKQMESYESRNTTSESLSQLDMAEVEYQEMVSIEQAAENGFEQMEDEFFTEGQDDAWVSQMSDSFSEVENQLKRFKMDSIQISDLECRSSTCKLEFTYSNQEDMEKALPLLYAEHAKTVNFKEVEGNGVNKVVAIYKR